jgi:hypothetical protein
MKKLLSFSLVFALITVLFWGCTKSSNNPPTLPPASSFSIDFSNFKTATKSASIDPQTKGITTNINWFLAVTNASFWNLMLTVNLAIPVAAFNKAVENKPVYINNNTWEWKFSVPVIGSTYNARLTGLVKTDSIKWDMFISKDGVGSFNEFSWFTGTSALDGKGGTWILNHSQAYQDPLIKIDWKVNGTAIGSIKYTYVRELKDNGAADLFNSSFIQYGLTSGTLNAFYNIHFNNSTTISDFKDVNIEWNTTTHNGHIKAFHYYQDNNWHCWDGTGVDVTCN